MLLPFVDVIICFLNYFFMTTFSVIFESIKVNENLLVAKFSTKVVAFEV